MTGPKGYARVDDYAAWRCICGHIQYANQEPGGPCQFCACTAHEAPSPPDSQPAGDAP